VKIDAAIVYGLLALWGVVWIGFLIVTRTGR